MNEKEKARRIRKILAGVKLLAAEYYQLTGKPLGVTGEVAEFVAAETLGLELAPPRTPGYDAIRRTRKGKQRIQIKGRAYGEDAKPGPGLLPWMDEPISASIMPSSSRVRCRMAFPSTN